PPSLHSFPTRRSSDLLRCSHPCTPTCTSGTSLSHGLESPYCRRHFFLRSSKSFTFLNRKADGKTLDGSGYRKTQAHGAIVSSVRSEEHTSGLQSLRHL